MLYTRKLKFICTGLDVSSLRTLGFNAKVNFSDRKKKKREKKRRGVEGGKVKGGGGGGKRGAGGWKEEMEFYQN